MENWRSSKPLPPPEYQVPNLTRWRIDQALRWWETLRAPHKAYLKDAFNVVELDVNQIARMYYLCKWP